MQKLVFGSLLIMIIGLVLWNVYLVTQIENYKEQEEELNYKVEMLEGSLKVLEYDLITVRDSLRILSSYKNDKQSNRDIYLNK